jgi:Na+/melibiose symporter-like transporter
MNENVVAVFIPIVFFLVSGLIAVVYFYLRSRERQMLIEKNLDAATIKEFFETKRNSDPFRLLKFGIICFFFGLGLGIGLILEDTTDRGYWIPLLLFTVTGIGFAVANLVSHKLSNRS